jgi:hypothetical protein
MLLIKNIAWWSWVAVLTAAFLMAWAFLALPTHLSRIAMGRLNGGLRPSFAARLSSAVVVTVRGVLIVSVGAMLWGAAWMFGIVSLPPDPALVALD